MEARQVHVLQASLHEALVQAWRIPYVLQVWTRQAYRKNLPSEAAGGIGKPTTQGKIEHWFRTYDLEHARFPLHRKFIQYYNYERPRMSLNYKTPAEVFFGDVQDVMG
jgi:hypothetical protein